MQRITSAYRVSALLLAMFLALSLCVVPAGAQTDTLVAVDPAETTIPLGNQFEVEITVTDGVNVNAFDIRITYDQQSLSLVTWSHGDYLRAISCVNEIKFPGLLELGCTQLGQSPVSGDGVLLELNFDTLVLGQAGINIGNASFADSSGVQTQPLRAGGVVNVQSLPTYTPTFTPTLTPTLTRTPIPTLTPIFTQTAAAAQETATPINSMATATAWVPTAGSDPALQVTRPTPDGSTPTITPISGVVGPSTKAPTPENAFQTAMAATPSDAEGMTPGATQADQPPEGNDPESGEPSGIERSSSAWNSILIGVLIIAVFALVVMTIILIRRRQQKEEDLLL